MTDDGRRWLYVLGEKSGNDIKIGITDKALGVRRTAIDNEQMNGDSYVLLVAVRGSSQAERAIKAQFAEHRHVNKGNRTEYYEPAEEIVEWVAWLRQQFYVTHDEWTDANDRPEMDMNLWLPGNGRRETKPKKREDQLFEYQQSTGTLTGTAWDWLPDFDETYKDYFTPPDLVRCASIAMGGIDLDAASHFKANQRLAEAGVEIGDYFHNLKSAFDYEWFGRVWLNPPYGENGRWFRRAEEMIDRGLVEQLCWLSPAWVFITQISQSMVERSTASVLLSPTPVFFNPGNPLKTGVNHPHMIFYWGERTTEFRDAFRKHGIPMRLYP